MMLGMIARSRRRAISRRSSRCSRVAAPRVSVRRRRGIRDRVKQATGARRREAAGEECRAAHNQERRRQCQQHLAPLVPPAKWERPWRQRLRPPQPRCRSIRRRCNSGRRCSTFRARPPAGGFGLNFMQTLGFGDPTAAFFGGTGGSVAAGDYVAVMTVSRQDAASEDSRGEAEPVVGMLSSRC